MPNATNNTDGRLMSGSVNEHRSRWRRKFSTFLNTADRRQTTASHFHFNKTISTTQKSHKWKCNVQSVTANKLCDQLMFKTGCTEIQTQTHVETDATATFISLNLAMC